MYRMLTMTSAAMICAAISLAARPNTRPISTTPQNQDSAEFQVQLPQAPPPQTLQSQPWSHAASGLSEAGPRHAPAMIPGGSTVLDPYTGGAVRLITSFEAAPVADSSSLATGGATGPGGACTCDSQCAAAAGQCQVAHCVGGVCVQEKAPVDTVCSNDGLFCTEERCDGNGVCMNTTVGGGSATRISPCTKQCCTTAACTAGSFQNCFEANDCVGTEGCFLKRQAFGSTYVATCDEALDRCFVATTAAPVVPVGRCCSFAGACSITTQAACSSGLWLRFRDPDDVLHVCNASLGCPKYSSGIAPVDDPTMQINIGPVVPFARRCSIGGGLCEVNSDCIDRCNAGIRVNEACDVDMDCPGGGLCQPGGVLDLCIAAATECQGAGTFTSIGDDYSMSNGSYLRLSEFRFRGGVSEPNEIALFEFYDSSFAPPRLVNSFAFRFANPGIFDYRINVDCHPNCDLSQTQGTPGEEERSDPPFIISPTGFVVLRATRVGAVLSAISPQFGEDDGNLFWQNSLSAPEVGTNNGSSMWVNGVVGNNGALALDVLAFDLVGQKLTAAPLAACCNPASGTCTDRLPWDCRFCTNPAQTPCERQRDCGLDNEFTCTGRDWKGARTAAQVDNDAYRDCGSRYCFNPANPNPTTLTPCTGTGQGTCSFGQMCEAPCEVAACCTPGGCIEVASAGACSGAGGTLLGFGQKCAPNCCPQPFTGVDCCKDYYSCHTGGGPFTDAGVPCSFRCVSAPTQPCTEDFECPANDCNELPNSTADCPGGQSCRLVCDGPNNGADPRIHEINVPTYNLGTEQITVNFQGITAPATYLDDCTVGGGDFGWYEVFTIGKADSLDTCAEVTVNFCCSNPMMTPVQQTVTRGCPCASGETFYADVNSSGPQAGFGSECNNDFCCVDGNWSIQFTLPAGTYTYGIIADKSCSNNNVYCFADSDCDPGAWCRRNNTTYKGHLIVKPCAPGACCGEPEGAFNHCSVTDQFTCENERRYCKTNQAACVDNSTCPPGDTCLPGIFLGNKQVAPVPECDGDPCFLGACCTGPGTCVDNSGVGITFAACAASSGTYIGGFLCHENPCPVIPFADQDHCQSAIRGQFMLTSDRLISERRADDFRANGNVIRRLGFYPCFRGTTNFQQGFECSGTGPGMGEPPPDAFIAKIYEDDLGKPGPLVPGVPVNGFALTIDAKAPMDAGAGASRCWQYTAAVNSPSGLTVTPGDCYWLEITGLGEMQSRGNCFVHWLSSSDGNNYSMRDIDSLYALSDFVEADQAFCIDSSILGATNPPYSQDGGCGNLPVACCRPGPTCIDGGTYTQCVGTNQAPQTNIPFPFITCAQLAGMGGCPVPPNDLCANASMPAQCIGQSSNPNLGVCSLSGGPPNISEVCDMTIGVPPRNDCTNPLATCGPVPSSTDAYRCQFATDNRLATTDGPGNLSGTECYASGNESFQSDIWIKYTAPCTGVMTVHNCGSNNTLDSMLEVFSNNTATCSVCPIANQNQSLACSDDNCGGEGGGSAVRMNIADGDCYTIRMGGWSSTGSVADAGQNVSGLDIGVVCNPTLPFNPPVTAPPPHDRRKNRYISFAPNNGGISLAFRVATTASTFFPTCVGQSGWVQAPDANGISRLDATPVFRVWSEPVIHVGDEEIVPVANYTIFANSAGPTENPVGLAVPTIAQPTLNAKCWADVAGAFTGVEYAPPDGFANVGDLTAVLAFINNNAIKPHLTVVDVDPQVPNKIVNTADVNRVVAAIANAGYPFNLPPCSKVSCGGTVDIGACCLPNDSCVDSQSTTNCSNQSGTFQGDGTTCAQVNCTTSGACCLPDSTCVDSDAANCSAQSGDYKGDFTDCGDYSCGCDVNNNAIPDSTEVSCAVCREIPPAGLDLLATAGALNIIFLDNTQLPLPGLADANTAFGRSNPFNHGGPQEAGAAVMNGGMSPYADTAALAPEPRVVPPLFPNDPDFGPEIHIEILSLELTSASATVRAGQAMYNSLLLAGRTDLYQDSFGEAQSECIEMPGQIYFNAFFEIETGGQKLYNRHPVVLRGEVQAVPIDLNDSIKELINDPSFPAVALFDQDGVHQAYLQSAVLGGDPSVPRGTAGRSGGQVSAMLGGGILAPDSCNSQRAFSAPISFTVDAASNGILLTLPPDPNEVNEDSTPQSPRKPVTVYRSAGLNPNLPPDKSNARAEDPGFNLRGEVGLPGQFVAGDAINALSFGKDGTVNSTVPGQRPVLMFSVDRSSAGNVSSDVHKEAVSTPVQVAADMFIAPAIPVSGSQSFGAYPVNSSGPFVPPCSAGRGSCQVSDQTSLGLRPLFGGLGHDDVTSLEASRFILSDRAYMTFTGPSFDGDGNTIYTFNGDVAFSPDSANFIPFAGPASMGLIGGMPGDVIDALVLSDTTPGSIPQQPNGILNPGPLGQDEVLFSLGVGSPSLTLSPVCITVGGCSPADIFYSNFTGSFSRRYTAATLGLLHTDNVDALDISPGAGIADCNVNGIDDLCEIELGRSADANMNQLPDECEGKNRYITFSPNFVYSDGDASADEVAFRVDLLDSFYSPESPGNKVTGTIGWVGPPSYQCDGGTNNNLTCIPPGGCPGGACTIITATIVPQSEAAPFQGPWPLIVHVGDCEIFPVAHYLITPTTDPTSRPVQAGHPFATTLQPQGKFWGDVVGIVDAMTGAYTPPNGIVNVTDVQAIKFRIEIQFTNTPKPSFPAASLLGAGAGDKCLNSQVNVADLQIVVLAAQGMPYPPGLPTDPFLAGGVLACPPCP